MGLHAWTRLWERFGQDNGERLELLILGMIEAGCARYVGRARRGMHAWDVSLPGGEDVRAIVSPCSRILVTVLTPNMHVYRPRRSGH